MVMLLFLCFVGLSAAFKPQGFQSRQNFVPRAPAPAAPSSSQDCVTRPGQWSPCSVSCGGGFRTRPLVIVSRPSGYGAPCPDLHGFQESCNTHPCPVDCLVEQGTFSECSATCGEGIRIKVDIIIREAKYGGLECPSPNELITRESCQNLPPCPQPIHCEIGYTEFSQCSASCGVGFKTRNAFVQTQAAHGGAECPSDLTALSTTVQCQLEPCPEINDCVYQFGEWSECDATCGEAVRRRRIYIMSQPTSGGAACPTDLYQTEPCRNVPCPYPVDCEVEWGQWTQCSNPCGDGIQTLTGRIVVYPQNGGRKCPLELESQRACGQQCLPQTQCELVYGEYSSCPVTCGGGYRFRKAFIKTPGPDCPAPQNLLQQVPCAQQPCPNNVDCVVRRSYWSDCNVSCGDGIQTRSVEIITPAQGSGIPCPTQLQEQRQCSANRQCAPPSHGYRHRRF